ncbi:MULTISPECIES: NYN domain-containing protein [Thermodesulfovibrio]|jgi:predicted RNA-binding protein with PIN domain|uniref:NYN domain-containing protein n=1 Tax=Thermodesulfovibrio TaxID=28261 RepID=UPI00261BA4FA|nr:NYN domain-containing protein [Thermodesulfovibrio sp.]
MAKILIDGYNLIGIAHRDLKKARQNLIERLIDYRKIKGHDIIVVFDGYKEGTGKETCEHIGGIRIIYSGAGEKADDVIKRIIKQERSFFIVISSDRDIEKSAWRENCVAIDSSLFSDILDGEELYFENPKGVTLSKKEKAVKQALMKLI